jgi:LmbE family N-acetylglucosaminyl deacetylase
LKRILFIGAHPDDETFFAAGTFAKYRESGVEIHVLSATRGDQGKCGGVCTPEELPQVRERELADAMDAIGGAHIEFLPYHDKKLSEAPIEEMRDYLVASIRRVRPDIAITFDPHGANQHPDHIAISRFVSDAVPIAADPRWLPQAGIPHRIERLLWTPPTILYRLPADADPRELPGFDFVIDVERWKEQKTKAFEAHRTQFPGLKKLFFDNPNGQRTFGIEAFRLAAGERPAVIPADDLFAR